MSGPKEGEQVVVVGGGPVGLALAGELGWRGIRCLLVDKGDGTIYQPKMDWVGVRTMEFCRRWGIVEAVQGCAYPNHRPQDNVYATSLTGYEFGRHAVPAMKETPPFAQSPEHHYRCPQNMFDPILLEHARSYGHVEIRYHTELIGITAGDCGLHALVRDTETGAQNNIAASYLVGCDGANSTIRPLIGSQMSGPGVLTNTTNVIFRSSDRTLLDNTNTGYRWIFIGPEGTWATLVAINGYDQWRFSLIGTAESAAPSSEEIHAAIERAVGAPIEYEILSVLSWARREAVATSYGSGRVFLAGDAAHVMSPTGGFGMNTGIGDAVDLGWKLDAVISGWGGKSLLPSYETERRPVAVRNSTEASANLLRMLWPRRERPSALVFESSEAGNRARQEYGATFSELMSHEWNTLQIHLGYVYHNSPICLGSTVTCSQNLMDHYVQTIDIGARAPHVWLEHGNSTLDWYGRGFVLVETTEKGEVSRGDGFRAAAHDRGIPLTVRSSGIDSLKSAYTRRFTLVRPDGHICWCADDVLERAEAGYVLDVARGHALHADAIVGPKESSFRGVSK